MPSFTIDLGSLVEWVAAAGSIGAIFAAVAGFRIVDRQREKDRRDRERAVGFNLMASLLDIGNNIEALRQHIRSQRNDITIETADRRCIRYKTIQALVGISSEGDVDLPDGTTELFVRASLVDLWNETLLLRRHNASLTQIMKDYRELWIKTMEKLPLPLAINGPFGHVQVDNEAFQALRPGLIQIDSMVDALDQQSAEASKLVQRVARNLGPALKKYLGEPFIEFSLPARAEGQQDERG